MNALGLFLAEWTAISVFAVLLLAAAALWRRG
jgi:hypothetical protein